jgi:hypothetical protein
MKSGTRGQVSTNVSASPALLYDTVSDMGHMGDWSPECRHCEWIDGSTGPSVGARFKGSNQRGVMRWSTKPRVIVADQGREFAFVTRHLGRDMTRWSYHFEAASDGTRVTESFEMLDDMPWYLRLADRLLIGVKDRKADLEASMEVTLKSLKTAMENPPAM